MPSSAKTFKVSAIVFTGPRNFDYQKLRHTALWFEPVGGGTTFYCSAVSGPGAFIFEKREDYEPSLAEKYADHVEVGMMRKTITYSDLESKMRSVPCRNDDEEFNCQNWVDDAVKKLYEDGYFTKEEYNQSMNKMTKITMETDDDVYKKVELNCMTAWAIMSVYGYTRAGTRGRIMQAGLAISSEGRQDQ